MATEVEIDDSLYSRQRYVLGDTAMQRMAKSNVLVYGIGGLGVEIAKNVILAGVKSVTVQDSKPATYLDLGTQFFLREEDVKAGNNRAKASCEKLAELNPYVSVTAKQEPLNDTTDLSYLTDFQCVILTEAPLKLQLKINEFCRNQKTPISFITADVYGVFCWSFCDFGNDFEVSDTNGEEAKDVFISSITKENPGVVSTLENVMHGYETGDVVTFKEIQGMEALNGKQTPIKVLTPYKYSIMDTTGSEFGEYSSGGIATQVKVPKTIHFSSMEKELLSPSLQMADLSKMSAPATIHLAMRALYAFWEKNDRLPNIRCETDADEVVRLANEANESAENKVDDLDERTVRHLSHTCQGSLAPLCAFLGGMVAQEALKAISGKFMPLMQWFHLDAVEVLNGLESTPAQNFLPQQQRTDALRICMGEDMCQKLAQLRLFMVGCGAIGCEMLKNYALLGIGTQGNGQITITDNDIIEKSNLNRQFLFRPQHIRQPKSTTAASSAKDINPHLRIDAQQHKVCPQTELTTYTDAFFEAQDIIVNALDNVEARRYMDSRCVTNQRPLLESGTMGAKGHVQTIVPFLTESYSSQRDPVDEDVPYCTLKSFPATIEHCIQWARDKFESSFAQKAALYNKFWETNGSQDDVVKALVAGANLEGAVTVSKLVARRPADFPACVTIARAKFEKYFNHKAKHLLHAFPLDQRLQDGTSFWQSPKRPPTPQVFDPTNDMHLSFISACARLYAEVCQVPVTAADVQPSNLQRILQTVPVPQYKPSNKKIITDESAKKEEDEETSSGDEIQDAANRIAASTNKANGDGVCRTMTPQMFEKDDDSNGHIDFITAASNLRAAMYSIEAADRLKTKRIAGRIVPAIATTTAAVSGLVSLELIKLAEEGTPMEHYKNCFLNLALPVVLFSEPGAVEKTKMSTGVEYSLWDRWVVQGHKDFTLQQFLEYFAAPPRNLTVTMVVLGVKMVYVPIMPGHKKRLPQTMMKLLKPTPDRKYMDLVVSYANPDNDEDQMGPPVRYFFNN